jgi:hypothetical protein
LEFSRREEEPKKNTEGLCHPLGEMLSGDPRGREYIIFRRVAGDNFLGEVLCMDLSFNNNGLNIKK